MAGLLFLSVNHVFIKSALFLKKTLGQGDGFSDLRTNPEVAPAEKYAVFVSTVQKTLERTVQFLFSLMVYSQFSNHSLHEK